MIGMVVNGVCMRRCKPVWLARVLALLAYVIARMALLADGVVSPCLSITWRC